LFVVDFAQEERRKTGSWFFDYTRIEIEYVIENVMVVFNGICGVPTTVVVLLQLV